jgi:CheY-like chemotaxis protein
MGQLPSSARNLSIMSRIPVLDDDAPFIDFMVPTLTQNAHAFDFALQAREGSKKLAETQHDAIACDIVMPGPECVKAMTSMRMALPDVATVATGRGLTERPCNRFDDAGSPARHAAPRA